MDARQALQDALRQLPRMNTLLHAIFDDRKLSVLVISAYDDTITYYNTNVGLVPDGGPTRLTPNFTGRTLKELAEAWDYPLEESPAWRCLRDPQHNMQVTNAIKSGNWLIASLIEASDNDRGSGEVLQTEHSKDTDRQRAIDAHCLISERVGISMELEEACARRHVALASLIEADKRIDWVRNQLIEAGRRLLD